MAVAARICPGLPSRPGRNTVILSSSQARQFWSGFGTKRIVANSLLSGDASLQTLFGWDVQSGKPVWAWAGAFVCDGLVTGCFLFASVLVAFNSRFPDVSSSDWLL